MSSRYSRAGSSGDPGREPHPACPAPPPYSRAWSMSMDSGAQMSFNEFAAGSSGSSLGGERAWMRPSVAVSCSSAGTPATAIPSVVSVRSCRPSTTMTPWRMAQNRTGYMQMGSTKAYITVARSRRLSVSSFLATSRAPRRGERVREVGMVCRPYGCGSALPSPGDRGGGFKKGLP